MSGMCLAPFRIHLQGDVDLVVLQEMQGTKGDDTSEQNHVRKKVQRDQRPTVVLDQ